MSFVEMTNIPGLSANITEETLNLSIRLQNQFPSDNPFPQTDVLSDGFKALCAIIAKYNVQSLFQLRLLHHHMMVPEKHILLGGSITERRGYWTQPTPISDVDLHKIHGHIFSVDTTGCTGEGEKRTLVPSEFREGPPSVGNIDGSFFAEFISCLQQNSLEKTLGLEVVTPDQTGKMIEFSFNTGSLLLEEEEVKAEVRKEIGFQETGWAVEIKDGIVCRQGKEICSPTSAGHLRWYDTKIKGALDAVEILRAEGVLVM